MAIKCTLFLAVSTIIIVHVFASDFKLVGHWTFEKGEETKDLTGNFCDVHRKGGAVIENGQLDLGRGNWAVAGDYTGPTIEEKTLVSWVSIDNFNVQRGSVLSLDKVSVDQFDAIVLGERMANHWMAGSSYFRRTEDAKPGFKETKTNVMVQLAISYENENGKARIRLYRNGEKFGEYMKGPFVTWPRGDAEVFWGIRHGNAQRGGPDNMDAHIEESRIYAGVLDSKDLLKLRLKGIDYCLWIKYSLYWHKVDYVITKSRDNFSIIIILSLITICVKLRLCNCKFYPTGRLSLVGHWTFEKGEETKDLTGNFCHVHLKGAVIENGQLDLGRGKWAVAGDYTGPTIEEKTLVSWVSIDNFNVQRGSVLSLDKVSVDQFDAIVLGERMEITGWLGAATSVVLKMLSRDLKRQKQM